MDNPVIIFGANGLGKAVHDVFTSNGVVVYGFLDDDKALHGNEIKDIFVLGSTDDDGFLKLIGKKCEAVIAVDDNKLKKSLVEMLKKRRKMMPVNAIHKSTIISESANLGHGNIINAGTVVGANVVVGNHCILHSNTTIDFESSLGDFVQVGAGSIINTGVTIDDEVFVGSGVTIISGVNVGKGARIGAGSVVIADVKKGQTVFGNPAKAL